MQQTKKRRHARVSKQDYQRSIWNYLERRNAYKKKYGLHSEEYKRLSIRLNMKIKTWKQALRRIEKSHESISKVNNAIKFVFQVDLRAGHFNKNAWGVTWLAKRCFSKYCIESGLQPYKVSQFMGLCKGTSQRMRRSLNKSFVVNLKNKESYMMFVDYIKSGDIPENYSL